MTSYQAPLDQLLRLGEADLHHWLDYLSMGFGPEHVPDLIRMATDPGLIDADWESTQVWTPIHAWRTLGLLRATEAIEPLLEIATDDFDWAFDDLPGVFSQIGPDALPVLANFLADRSRDPSARKLAAWCIESVVHEHPKTRSVGVEALARGLDEVSRNPSELNGDLVDVLVKLKALPEDPVSGILAMFEVLQQMPEVDIDTGIGAALVRALVRSQ